MQLLLEEVVERLTKVLGVAVVEVPEVIERLNLPQQDLILQVLLMVIHLLQTE